MRIIVDAMGGDNAPKAVIEGAALAAAELKADIVLVGRGEELLEAMKSLGMGELPDGLEIANASEVIDMDDEPGTVIRRKKDSSMVVGLNMLRDGEGSAFVSAGSTGALLSGATLLVKRIRGMRRAALAPITPKLLGNRVIIDSGANIDCTPEYLLQFAIMGSSLSKNVIGKLSPKVGLLNIGTEETKGTQLHRDSYGVLKSASEAGHINFIGNIEARDAITGDVDVIVCDGFSGNIFLKTIEGMGLFFMKSMKDMFMSNLKTKIAALLMKSKISEFRKGVDYSEVGGSILLGISKPVIKAHGSSDAKAIYSAIALAVKCAESNYIKEIEQSMVIEQTTDNDTE